jgi:hypothetical protein
VKKALFDRLEKAILASRPKVAKGLQSGLTEARINDILNRAKVSTNVDAVLALYSWKNGADTAKAQETFLPKSIYQFLPLEAAVKHCANLEEATNTLVALGSPVKMSQEAGRYLPVFWDGVTGYLAIDLKPGMGNRVMEIEFESEEPFRKVCDSFDAFLTDATRAIQENESLAFLT